MIMGAMETSLPYTQSDEGSDLQAETFADHPFIPVTIVFLVLTYISVALRIWTRKCFVKYMGWDDVAMVVTLIFFSVFCATLIALFALVGTARAIHAVDFERIKTVVNVLLCTEIFYIITMIALKISLGLFFLRFLITRWHRMLIITAVTISTIFGVAHLFFAIFQCRSFSKIEVFISRMISGTCAAESIGKGMNYTYATLTMITDWICGLLPIFVLRESSTMPKRTKVAVGGLLVVGSLGSIASVIRIKFIAGITITTGNFFDNTSKLAIWSTIELGTGITVASLAALRPLIKSAFEKTRSLTSKGRSNQPTWQSRNTPQASPIRATFELEDQRIDSASSPTPVKSAEEKESLADIDAEMRAYGMSEVDSNPTVGIDGLGVAVPDGYSTCNPQYGDQRAASTSETVG